MDKQMLNPVSPGEMLRDEFLVPMGITKCYLARCIGVSPQRIGEIVRGRRSITPDTDLRLCKFFNLSSGYWLRIQELYDTEMTRRLIEPALEKIQPYVPMAGKTRKKLTYAKA
jgi:addiction module HigA family antidote